MTHLTTGDPAPWFTARSPGNPKFNFSSVAGRYVLLGFLPPLGPQRAAAFEGLRHNTGLLDDNHIVAFVVVPDAESFANARDRNGLRWFFDPEGRLADLYGAINKDGSLEPTWFVLDPSLRILFTAPMIQSEPMWDRLRTVAAPDEHAGTALHAPVMIVPRLFEPDLCRRLIAYYDDRGGEVSGVMREVGGRTVAVVDDFKRRRDATIEDEAQCAETRERMVRRLMPEILKAFRFNVTRIERYIVARYAAEDGGYFRAHRDNGTAGTAHRQFACSINLNAEEFEGGDLRFPEYGMRSYRPPTGGAVVFSCSLLHEAQPVTRGVRYAFLPFLYDEAGEELRQRNLHLVGDAPPIEPNSAPEPEPELLPG